MHILNTDFSCYRKSVNYSSFHTPDVLNQGLVAITSCRVITTLEIQLFIFNLIYILHCGSCFVWNAVIRQSTVQIFCRNLYIQRTLQKF
jgi:hypothetical protein